MNINTITVLNHEGRAFRTSLVREGDRYGLRDDKGVPVLVHEKSDPLVEFHDLSMPKKFGDQGQFVSRYYLSTLLGGRDGAGLALDVGVSEWTLDGCAMDQVRRWLRAVTK